MEKLNNPNVNDIQQQHHLKRISFDAHSSARIGFAILFIPCLFLLGVFLKYRLGIDLKLFTAVEEALSNLDKTPYLKIIIPLLLVGLPIMSIVINLLALIQIYWDKVKNEYIIIIKQEHLTLILLLITMCIVAVIVLFVAVENTGHFSFIL